MAGADSVFTIDLYTETSLTILSGVAYSSIFVRHQSPDSHIINLHLQTFCLRFSLYPLCYNHSIHLLSAIFSLPLFEAVCNSLYSFFLRERERNNHLIVRVQISLPFQARIQKFFKGGGLKRKILKEKCSLIHKNQTNMQLFLSSSFSRIVLELIFLI